MKLAALMIALSSLAAFALAQDSQMAERGKQEEQHSCIQCHSLRLVDSQRLSPAAWEKEVNKMIGWGAPVTNKQLLIDYLSQQYSLSKPMAPDPMTGNGASGKTH